MELTALRVVCKEGASDDVNFARGARKMLLEIRTAIAEFEHAVREPHLFDHEPSICVRRRELIDQLREIVNSPVVQTHLTDDL